MRNTLVLAMVAWLFVGVSVANNEDVRLSTISMAKLPAHVVALPGKLTLFADFGKKSERGVPLYFVNRAGKPVELLTYMAQPILTMEYESAPGKWKRAAWLNSPKCGNSFRSSKLPGNTFGLVYDSIPRVGLEAKVQYRYDDKVVSNAGEGVVSKVDLKYFEWLEELEAKLKDE